MLKVGTLFSGGLAAVEFALKYENIKHEIVFACEFDKYARNQYLKFHSEPSSAFYNDVNDVDGLKYKNSIDLMVWGSPCQDLSIGGKRKGFNGEKSSLFRVGAKIQDDIKPHIFIFENVVGLLSSNGGADYQEVLATFREQGYNLVTLKMNTKNYGIPQNRDRIFIVGFLDIEEYHSFREPAKSDLKLCLKDLLEDEVDEKYFLNDDMVAKFIPGSSSLNQNYKSQANKIHDINNISPTLCAGSHGYSGGYVKIELKQVGNIDQKGHNSLWGRVYTPNGLAPTLNANGGGAGAKTGLFKINKKDNFRIRRLTPKETFLLQGLKKEDIELINSDTQSYKISGNAISVNVMQELLKSLYKQNNQQKNSLFDFLVPGTTNVA